MNQVIETLNDIFTLNRQVRLAIQKNGKLFDASKSLLTRYGIELPAIRGKSLIYSPSERPNLQIIFVRQSDIPWYLERELADFGIVGMDQIEESGSRVPIVGTLGLAKCKLSIAVLKKSPITSVDELEGKIIATSFPRILKRFLDGVGVEPREIVVLRGSVEAAPRLGAADAICDLVETGETLAANGLRPILTVLNSEALLARSYLKPSIGNTQGVSNRIDAIA